MGREIKRVAANFQWPAGKVWAGFLNPFYKHSHKCPDCGGSGYSPEAEKYKDEWYGFGTSKFEPVAYGSKLIEVNDPKLVDQVGQKVDRSIRESAGTKSPEHYTDGGRLTREEAVEREAVRLAEIFNGQWCHHLIAADVKALVDDERLSDFTRRPLPGIPMEDYIRTHAYLLWEEDIKSGKPELTADQYWSQSVEDHGRHWLPRNNGFVPTPEQVNCWSLFGFGHDSINCHACIEARCERGGHEFLCKTCGGHGNYWEPSIAERWSDEWEKEEPPSGEAYQVWETVSEGSPISPAFLDPLKLAEWLSKAPPWGAAEPMSSENWLKWITGPGWAPSAVISDGVIRDGVAASV